MFYVILYVNTLFVTVWADIFRENFSSGWWTQWLQKGCCIFLGICSMPGLGSHRASILLLWNFVIPLLQCSISWWTISSSYCSSFPARRAKIMFTDHSDVLIWYECGRLDPLTGTCLSDQVQLEVLQRSHRPDGNLLLVHRNTIRGLCVDRKQLTLVSHDGLHNVVCYYYYYYYDYY